MKSAPIIIFVVYTLLLPILCSRINSKLYEDVITENQNHIIDTLNDSEMVQQQNHDEAQTVDEQRNDNTVAYVKASIPIRIFQCMQRLNILKCMKIFILQRMERTPSYLNSGNVTSDFLDQILANNPSENDRESNDDILDKYYLQMPEVEINERLLKSFQRFFHDREIKLHFIPGMVVKVVPSEENAINLSLKRASTWVDIDTHGTGRGIKNRPGDYLVQLGVPAVLMPAILMGTVIPFILPALKFATIFSGLINHAALLSAIVYAAKNAALTSDVTKHLYYNPGYHRRSTASL